MNVAQPKRLQEVNRQFLGFGVVAKGASHRVLRCCSVVARAILPPPPALAGSLGLAAALTDQIGAADGLGNPDLRRLEVNALDLGDNIEDRRGSRAGAVRPSLERVPAPRRMLVGVILVRAVNMGALAIPRNPQPGEHDALAPSYRVADRLGRDVLLRAIHDLTPL